MLGTSGKGLYVGGGGGRRVENKDHIKGRASEGEGDWNTTK